MSQFTERVRAILLPSTDHTVRSHPSLTLSLRPKALVPQRTFYYIIIYLYIDVRAPRIWVLSFLSGFVPKARHRNLCSGRRES